MERGKQRTRHTGELDQHPCNVRNVGRKAECPIVHLDLFPLRRLPRCIQQNVDGALAVAVCLAVENWHSDDAALATVLETKQDLVLASELRVAVCVCWCRVIEGSVAASRSVPVEDIVGADVDKEERVGGRDGEGGKEGGNSDVELDGGLGISFDGVRFLWSRRGETVRRWRGQAKTRTYPFGGAVDDNFGLELRKCLLDGLLVVQVELDMSRKVFRVRNERVGRGRGNRTFMRSPEAREKAVPVTAGVQRQLQRTVER